MKDVKKQTKDEVNELRKENEILKKLARSMPSFNETSLDASYEKEFDYYVKKQNLLMHINEYAMHLTSISIDDDFFLKTCKKLREITGALAVTFSLYDKNTSEIVTRGMAASDNDISLLEKTIGKRMIGNRYKISEEWYSRMLSKPIIETTSIHQLTFENFPKPLSTLIEKLFSIDWILGLVLVHRGEVLGTVALVGTKGTVKFNSSDFQGFAGITTIALQRWLSEKSKFEEQQKLNIISQNSSDVIWIIDMNMQFTYVSPSVERIRGFNAEEAMKMTLEQILMPNSLKQVQERMQYEMAIEQSGNFDPDRTATIELEEYHKDGSTVWVETKVKFLRNEFMQPIGLIGISRDITERKKLDNRIVILSEALYHSLNGFDIVDENGVFVYANIAYARMWGYESTDEIIGTSPAGHCLDTNMPDKIVADVLANGQGRFEFIAKRKDGTTFPVLMDVFLFVDEAGNKLFISSSNDITDLKLSEEKLRKNENNLMITLNSIGDAVISTDEQGNIVMMNPTAEKLTGWEFEQAKDKPLSRIFCIIDAKTREKVDDPVSVVLSERKTIGLANHTILISKDGSEKQISETAAPILDQDGQIHGVVLVFSDVTQEYLIREQLKRNEKLLRLSEMTAGFGYWKINILDRTTDISSGTRNICGFGNDDISIDDLFKILLPQYREKFKSIIDNLDSKDVQNEFEFTIRTKNDGLIKFLHTTIDVAEDKLSVSGVMKDISQIKQAQESLVLSEARYRQIVEKINIGLIIQQNNKIVFANNAAFHMFGFESADDFMGKNIIDFIHKEDKSDVLQLLQTSQYTELSELKDPGFEKRLMRKDKKVLTIDVSSTSVDYNDTTAVMIWIYDVSKKKEAELALQRSEIKYKSLAETIQDNIIRYDKDLKVKYINPAGIFYFDISENDYVGKTTQELGLFDISSTLFWENNLQSVMINGKNQRFQIELFRNEVFYFLDWYLTPEFDVNGEIRSVMCISRDITEMKMIQIEMEKEKIKAQEADSLKSAFLANMSHEIRTPMNGIIGFSNLLSQTDLSFEERKEYADVLNKSAHRLMNLINNIIDLSKIETNQMPIILTCFDINKALYEIFEYFKKSIQDKPIDINLVYGLADNNSVIFGDEMKIVHVVKTLLDNAVKFTYSGKIDFGYEVIGSDLFFFVNDTGTGISDRFIDKVFDRFSQEDNSFNRSYEGSGLGLCIAKGLIELLGGSIGVDSKKDVGSKFYFRIPYRTHSDIIDEPNVEIIDKDNSSKYKILIAEDDKISFLLLKNLLLKTSSYEILHAVNGEEAVKIVKKYSEIVCIFMDMKMPIMDGLTATRLIKQINSELPIIAVTALAMLGDREKALTAGCSHYITKPFNPKEVIAALEKYCKV